MPPIPSASATGRTAARAPLGWLPVEALTSHPPRPAQSPYDGRSAAPRCGESHTGLMSHSRGRDRGRPLHDIAQPLAAGRRDDAMVLPTSRTPERVTRLEPRLTPCHCGCTPVLPFMCVAGRASNATCPQCPLPKHRENSAPAAARSRACPREDTQTSHDKPPVPPTVRRRCPSGCRGQLWGTRMSVVKRGRPLPSSVVMPPSPTVAEPPESHCLPRLSRV